MIIDFHAHLAREQEGVPPFMRLLFDVDGYLERQQAAGISRTVLSFALDATPGAKLTLDDVKQEHDFLADLVARHPTRFVALGAVDPFGGDTWLREAERALQNGFTGLCFPTSRNGKYLDDAEAGGAFALAEQRRALIFLHPTASPIGIDVAGHPMMNGWLGRPYDTGVCLARMLIAGTFEGYPNMRMVVAHCGGVLPMLLGRLDEVYQGMKRAAAFGAGSGGGPPPGFKPPPGMMMGGNLKASATRPPSEQARSLYLDTASYHRVAIRAAIDAVGADHVVFGTDHPPVHTLPQSTVDIIKALGLTREEEEKVFTRNAETLLGKPNA